MSSCTYNCFMNVINIGNSIIGVSILAMPYCFRKCGILLSIILIFVSGILTRTACYLLLKSAIMARRRNFEFLAFHTFGTTGKLAVEISVVGFLIGVCIAFFVVIGDLGPPLAAEFLMFDNSSNLRTNLLIMVGVCVALPLGMLRKIDSLTSLSALSIAFYACLILKIFAEAVPNLAANEWWYKVNWWRSAGILPCLPIFSMALSCQTQLFEFFDTSNDASLKKMQSVIAGAVHLCSTVYIMVGTLGYIAFHNKAIAGNILVLLTPSMITEIIKLGFILTVAVSFPLCLFPCRSSLHSLLFKQGFAHHDINITTIPEFRFRILTISLIIITIGIAIMVPNIEFVLGLIGSTIGTLICLIFPALMFIHDTSKNTTEKRMAQVLVGIGFFILIACTYSTLQEDANQPDTVAENIQNIVKVTESKLAASSIAIDILPSQPAKEEAKLLKNDKEEKPPDKDIPEQKRLEPPVPQEPEIKADQNGDLDPQALQKEDKEIQKDIPSSSSSLDISKKEKNIDKQENLLRKLEQQHKEQKLILEQQKKVLEELKLHKESHDERPKVVVENQPVLVSEVQKDENIPKVVPEKVIIPTQKSSDPIIPKAPLKPEQLDIAVHNDKVINIENKFVPPVINVSKDVPLKSTVLPVQNNIPNNINIDSNAKIIHQKPIEQHAINETQQKVAQVVPELVKKSVPPLPTVVSIPILVTSNVAVKDIPKVDVDKQNDAIPPVHVIQRETLGKEELSNVNEPIKNDLVKLTLNEVKAPT